MIKIIDDLLSPSYADAIENDAYNHLLYEYKRKTSVPSEGKYLIVEDENTYDDGQLVCDLWHIPNNYPQPMFNSYEPFIRPLTLTVMDKVKQFDLTPVRIKFNMLRRTDFPENHYNIPHIDFDTINKISALYYVNDSDGDTFLFNERFDETKVPEKLSIAQRVAPKKNRLVIFDSDRFHASSNPKTNPERIVINFVFQRNENS